MRKRLGLCAIVLGALGCALQGAPASKLSTEDLRPVRITQKLGAQVPLDLPFVDESGKEVSLREVMRGHPVILVPGYYGCPMLCGVVARGLINALLDLRLDVGTDFDVIHYSIDPSESPVLAAEMRRTYLRRYGRPGAAAGWRFLTGRAESSRALSDAIGFGFRYDPSIRQYAHAAGIAILTPEGRVSSYMLGVDFPARPLRLALVDASAEKLGSPADQLLLLCYHYNPVTGRYGMAIMTVLRLGGGATVALLAGGAGVLLWREKRRGLA